MSVLYITQNGVTDHIGQSQVAPYLIGLAGQGFRLHVLSAEKDGRDQLKQQYQRLFDTAGIRWTQVPYTNRPPLIGPALTQWRLKSAARRIVHNSAVKLIHCRSHPTALIGCGLKRATKVRYLFDFRDFYADGGLIKTRGLKRLAFRRFKALEGPMIRAADGVVCLTRRAIDLLKGWYLPDQADADTRFSVIPCCADFSHFDPASVTAKQCAAARAKAGLPDGAFAMAYLGSLGPDYLLPRMIQLFRQLLVIRPDAYFLFVSNNGRDLVEAECARQEVSPDHIRFVSGDRDEVPALIALAAMSVVFIRADQSKAGCSPTKLAELFAMGIPVIANAGVGDLDQIIDPARNGSALVREFSDEALRAAIQSVLSHTLTPAAIRENSRQFDVSAGVEAYAHMYRRLLENAEC